MPLKTLIIEDEPLSRVFLHNLLTEFCAAVEVIATVAAENEAVTAINKYQPDLLFLDIELQQGTGFQVLKKLSGPYPYVVFTTAFDHHAMKAIQFSGIDYLHKPIDIDGLQLAIEKAVQNKEKNNHETAIRHLLQTLQNNYSPLHLYIPTENENKYLPVDEIICVQSSEADSCFIMRDGSTQKATRCLKEYELLLQEYSFLRVHQQYLVNGKAIDLSVPFSADSLLLCNGSKIPLSPKKTEEVRKLFKGQN